MNILKALVDFYLRALPQYVPSGGIWYIPTGNEFAVKDKIEIDGKIEVDGRLVIIN